MIGRKVMLITRSTLVLPFLLQFLSLPVAAQQPDNSVSNLKKPESRILDAARVLPESLENRLAKILDRAAGTHELDLYVAILPDLSGEEFPAEVANTLRSRWLNDNQPAAVLVYIEQEQRFAIGANQPLRQLDSERDIDSLPAKYEVLNNKRLTQSSAIYEAVADFDYSLRQLLQKQTDRAAMIEKIIFFLLSIIGVFLLSSLVLAFRNSALNKIFIKPVYLPKPTDCTERLGGRNCGGNLVVSKYSDDAH